MWCREQDGRRRSSRDSFGSSVAISASTALVGAPNNNSVTGAAYVYVNV